MQIEFRKLLLPSSSESFISITPTQKPKCEHMDNYFIFTVDVKLDHLPEWKKKCVKT